MLFQISSPVPENFDGIPTLNAQNANFYYFIDERGANDIDNLRTLFRLTLSYADTQMYEAEFSKAFNTAVAQNNVKWNITMGLFWIRPLHFLGLDACTRKMLENNRNRLNKVTLSDALGLIQKYLPAAAPNEKKNRVFIIDEINRGNISKVFGELITLIEPSKRLGQPEALRVRLPYSRQLFGVPDNVYLLGTMNTADRSIAAIDTALRRRFRFREMLPDAAVLDGILVDGISVADMLTRMNRRIAVLYDREHTIGHAYFMPLRTHPTRETLAEIFENAILPLLQEYFFEDYEKIRLVLGDNRKSDPAEQFITAAENDCDALFGSAGIDLDDSVTYEINRAAFRNIEAYRSI